MASDKIKVDIVAAYDDKEAKEALKDAEKIEGADPELTITADDKATPDVKAVIEAAETLAKADAKIIVAAQVEVAKADLKALQQQAADLEAETITLDVDASKAKQGLDEVRTSADQSGSVLANMVGNTTQDLAGLGGVAGTAGMALGQLGEYATEGNINLQNLGKMAGPMLGVAAAGLVVSTVVGKMQENAKRAKEEFKDLVKVQADLAAGEIVAAAKTLSERYADLTTKAAAFGLEVVDVADAIVGSGDTITDLDGRIARLAVQYEEANTKATMYADGGAETLAAKLYDTISALQGVREELVQARTSYGNADTDAADAAASQLAFEDALKKVGPAATNAGGRVRDFNADTLDAKDAAEDATTAVEQFDAKIRLLLGQIDQEQAWLTLKQNIEDLTAKMYEAGAGTDEHRLALLELQEEQITYVAGLANIPVEKKTEIIAVIREGDLEATELALAKLAESRYVTYIPVPWTGAGSGRAPGLPKPQMATPPPAVAAGAPTAAGAFTVNVNMPNGSRGVDVVRQISGQARRSGRRYGTPVVHYARWRPPGHGGHP